MKMHMKNNTGTIVIEMCFIMPIVITVIFIVINMMFIQINKGIATGAAYQVLCDRESYVSASSDNAETVLQETLDKKIRNSMQYLDELETDVHFKKEKHTVMPGITGSLYAVIKYEENHPGAGLILNKTVSQRKIKIEKKVRDISDNLRRWQLYGEIL